MTTQSAQTSPPPREGEGAARIALAAVWCATVRSHAAFQTPRFIWSGLPSAVEASAAAAHLAAQAGPVRLTGDRWDGQAVHLGISSLASTSESVGGDVPIDAQPQPWLADLLQDDESIALVVAGGRGLRVNRATLRQYEINYRIEPAATISGSPTNDPWSDNLSLPASWLIGASYVFLLGYAERNQSFHPVRTGNGFDARLLDDFSTSRPAI